MTSSRVEVTYRRLYGITYVSATRGGVRAEEMGKTKGAKDRGSAKSAFKAEKVRRDAKKAKEEEAKRRKG